MRLLKLMAIGFIFGLLLAEVLKAETHDFSDEPQLYTLEVWAEQQENGDILVTWNNYLAPSADEETLTFTFPEGNLVILLTRMDWTLPDTLSVIDVPDGYVVIGDLYVTLGEDEEYKFKVVPYAGF